MVVQGGDGIEDKQFQQMMGQIGSLTPAQFKALVQAYAGQSGQDAGRVWSSAVYATSEQHLAALGINSACPGCGSIAAALWASGRLPGGRLTELQKRAIEKMNRAGGIACRVENVEDVKRVIERADLKARE